MKDSDVIEILAYIKAHYPREVDEETAAAYTDSLRDLEFDETRAACACLVKTSRFFPSVAEIRHGVIEPALGLPTAADAHREARAAYLARMSMQACPEVHPLIEAVLNVLGDAPFEGSNSGAAKAQFLRLYGEMRSQVVEAANLRAAGLALPESQPVINGILEALPTARALGLPPNLEDEEEHGEESGDRTIRTS